MNVLTITPDPILGPSPRYRIYAFREDLRHYDINLNIKSFLSNYAFNMRINGKPNHPIVILRVFIAFLETLRYIFNAKQKYDVIIIHRRSVPMFHRQFDRLFISSGLPIIFDYDDAVFTQYPIDHLLQACSGISAGNEYLAAYARSVAPQAIVKVVPTVVDTEVMVPKPKRDSNLPVVVGWIGTPSTFHAYLEPILGDLVKVCAEFGATLRVVSSVVVKARTEELGAEFVNWTLEGELDQLQGFDIGLMPLADDHFVRGKCAFKLIQYGAVGIPSIGTNIGANAEVLLEGVTGFLTDDLQQMLERLRTLLEDRQLRASMGEQARKRISDHFSLESQVPVLADLILEVCNNSKRSNAGKLKGHGRHL